MEQLLFENYIKPDLKHQKDATSIITRVLKQVSRGRFEICNNICKVEILLHNQKRTVIISNLISMNEFADLVYIAAPREPSLDFFYKKIAHRKETLIICLKDYQDQFYRLGIEFENEYWYKFYSDKEIKDELRKLYQAGWIDYKKQLKEGKIIYDELGICGIFAMPYNMLFLSFVQQVKERYGNRLFVLKTVPKCKYLMDDKELIGDRFEVVSDYNLDCIEDIGKMCAHLIEVEKKKFSSQRSEMKTKIQTLQSENTRISDSQLYLLEKIKKYRLNNWVFLGVGFILGIIVYSLR